MTHWFEDLSKTMADEKIGRRTALRRVGGTVASVALAGAIPGLALAKSNKRCPGPPLCPEFVGCKGIPNTNCYCFNGNTGQNVCGCNTFCSSAKPCNTNKDCGRGGACITTNGCTGCGPGGICVPNCAKKKNRNCQLGSGHGLTATGRVV